ncbi:peptide deformylase [Microbacterium sp. AG790]|uniref:peptide deformylase n=1 Tax=Microbacterium sp. AG790 TaxID=2183995 RepID=UPI000EB20C9F|nr:peptide deformylase [Microbacterium sp. AG790]RKS89336.1 peptide deformylase [Microbacterium sp. AG790]
MAVRPIRLFGDPVLRAPSATIDVIDDGIRSLVQDLLDTVELPGRAGVAAPQIGVGLRAFSYNIDGDIGYVLNPVLTDVSGEPALVGEGCLSVPDLWHETLRYPWARVVGIDLDGNELVLEGEGLMAQALQHETDHLDGMLYISRLSPEERKVAMRRIRESSWF